MLYIVTILLWSQREGRTDSRWAGPMIKTVEQPDVERFVEPSEGVLPFFFSLKSFETKAYCVFEKIQYSKFKSKIE